MNRVLSLHLPEWSIDLWRRRNRAHDPDTVVLLVRTVAGRQVIGHCCHRALAAGVTPGMTTAQARAILPAHAKRRIAIEEHRPGAERRRLHKLALWARRHAPRVAVDPDGDGLLLDVTGCGRLYRGEARIITRLHDALRARGLTARMAIAPTVGGAWALARYGPRGGMIVAPADLPAALRPLPVEALRLTPETAAGLHELGVTRVADLEALARREVPRRFADVLPRLDQALGAHVEVIHPVRARRRPEVSFRFAGPVEDRAVIRHAVRRLLERLAQRLRRGGVGALRLRLTLVSEATIERNAADVVLALVLSGASQDAVHLWRLLEPRIERVSLQARVEALRLRATAVRPLAFRQLAGPGAPRAAGSRAWRVEVGQLCDLLSARLGPERICRVAAVESHLPERAFAYRPGRSAGATAASEAPRCDRPSRFLPTPEPVRTQALSPEGPVLRFCWRGHWYTVQECRGPERLTSEWWRDPSGGRDYFHVQTTGGQHFWLYRQARTRAWFLHGQWS